MSTTPPAEHPFALTPAQVAFRDEVRALVLASVAPGAGDANERQDFPADAVAALAQAGLLGVQVSLPGAGGAWGPPN